MNLRFDASLSNKSLQHSHISVLWVAKVQNFCQSTTLASSNEQLLPVYRCCRGHYGKSNFSSKWLFYTVGFVIVSCIGWC